LEEIAGYQKPDAERDLVAALPDLLDLLEVSPDRAVIETVWEKILEGQIFDLVRFNHSDDPLSPEELDEYTYLVAGSVGEFWSNLCADRLPGFSTMDRESHAALAVSYGKGLQRVNILRDWADDLLHGRRYLAAGRFEPEKSLAESQLISGLHWVAAVRVGRVRFSTVLPARLGLEMLPHLHEGSPKVKLTRQLVRRQLFAALPLLWRCSDGAQPMAAESRLDVRS
jgi:farnesyl-diphosphate farnesyltransferase